MGNRLTCGVIKKKHNIEGRRYIQVGKLLVYEVISSNQLGSLEFRRNIWANVRIGQGLRHSWPLKPREWMLLSRKCVKWESSEEL